MSEIAQAPAKRKGRPSTAALAVGGAIVVVVIAAVGFIVLKGGLKSGEQRYLDDLRDIQIAVRGHLTGYSPKRNSPGRFEALSRVPPPLMAMRNRGGVATALKEEDAGNVEITALGAAQTNPVGGKEHGGTPLWEDVDGDSRRVPANEALFYHEADPPPAVDHWNTTKVTVDDVDYVVDSRDWFIDIDLLVDKGFLKKQPSSASADNSAAGKGSYTWYFAENGEVKSMLYAFPRPETDGYQDVYP